MKFPPKSESECANVFPEGEYKARVKSAKEKNRQKTGAPMLEMELEVYKGQSKQVVWDWLLTDVPSMAYKLRHFAYAANLDAEYEAGEIKPWQCEKAEVTVRLKIEQDGDYGPQNRIADYVTDSANGAAQGRQGASDEPPVKDDDIPF